MHVAFVYSSWDRPSECHPELATVDASPYVGTPSLAAASLAAATPAQHTVTFHDDRVVPVVPDRNVDLVAMPIFTPQADRALALADRYRELGVPVVAGGIFTSLMPDEVAPHVDALCVGEGESVWPTILEDACKGQLKPRYDGNGHLKDLGALAIPRYELYAEWVDELRRQRRADYPDLDFPVQLSRGCPVGCSHCVLPAYLGPKLRLTPPHKVREAFEKILSLGSWRGATLIEDTTTLASPRIQRHLTAVAKACEDLPTRVAYIGSSPQFMRAAPDSMFDALRSLGTLQVYLMFGFGPTSRAATAHDATDEAIQIAVDTVNRIQDHGLEVYGSFAVGQEGEDDSVFDRVLDLCRRSSIRVAEFAVATPYPGTPEFQKLGEQGRLLGRPWSEYNDANVVFRPNRMTPETLQRIYIDLWKEFYRDRPRSRWPVQL
jgi:radical SAM superfamily enzyme YgiQ (UPF0313 family)